MNSNHREFYDQNAQEFPSIPLAPSGMSAASAMPSSDLHQKNPRRLTRNCSRYFQTDQQRKAESGQRKQ